MIFGLWHKGQTMTYKTFSVFFETYVWGYLGTAIGDNGDYLKLKLIGYNARERKALMRDLIDSHLASR
jgi:hypothetical protein